ncbi:MAG: ECF transporter S component [Chloroflexi bacterium]|nr:ECF transporter S component [Chloroflexota bacterium]
MLVRWIAALVAFLVVAGIGIVGIGDFSSEAAANTWALVAAIGLLVAFVVYAGIEYAQTGGFASISRQFDLRTVVLMPVAIAINIILGAAVANALKIPIYMDSIGTILVGVLAGPIPGALTGFVTNILWQYVIPPPFQGTVAAPFAIVAAVIGLLAGIFGRAGWLRPRPNRPVPQLLLGGLVTVVIVLAVSWLAYLGYQAIIGPAGLEVASDNGLFVVLGWLALVLVAATIVGLLALLFIRRDLTAAYVVVAGLLTGVIAALISAPISANLFSGVTGAGTDFLVAAFRQAGAEIGAATLGQGLISDPVDKITTFFVVYLVVTAMATRLKARFPQGERLLERPEGAPADDAGWRGAGA